MADAIRFLDLSEGTATLPTRGHEGDAGLDLYTSQITVCNPGYNMVPCGIAAELPEGTWGLVTGRSSTIRRGLLVPTSVMDAGYRGELCAVVWNLNDHQILVDVGERIAQLIVVPLPVLKPEWATCLSVSQRGSNGYGSTGR